MSTPEQLQEENERLKAKLAAYEAAQAAIAPKPTLLKKLQHIAFTPVEALFSVLTGTAKTFLDARIFLGIVLAVGLVGFGAFVYYYGSLSFFVAAAVLLAFLAWVLYMLKERAFQRKQAQLSQQLEQRSNSTNTPPLPLLLIDLLQNKDPHQQQQQAQQLKKQLQPYLSDGAQLVKAYAAKFLAFNSFLSLFTLLTSVSIGIIAFLQLEKFERQNALFEGQNELFGIQNERITEQTALMRSQDSLLRTQNQFLQQQLGQIDTQNLYIVEQIRQASIQNRYVREQIQQASIQNQYIREQITQADIQNRLVEQQNSKIDYQNRRFDQQTDFQRRSPLVLRFDNIMDAINQELKYPNNKERKLSKQLIGRIITLSAQLKPYRYLTSGDTLTAVPLSPERGQLLINLVESNLDSVTYRSIFRKANFEAADLRRADLSEADLGGVNLNGANLDGANLKGANLSKTNLREIIFRRVALKGVNLSRTDLSEMDLSEMDLSGADLTRADLSGANLSEANLSEVSLFGVDLRGADLRGADLSGVSLFGVDFNRADLRKVKLNNATTFSSTFLESLSKKKVLGHEEIKEKYYVDFNYIGDITDNTYEEYYLIKEKPKKD